MKVLLESLLIASRWLLAPFFVALVVALLALVTQAAMHAFHVASDLLALSKENVLLGALGVIDLTLTASLIVLVISSGYSNFVSRVDQNEHPDWPAWMGNISFNDWNLKLIFTVVIISGIKVLETYMEIDKESTREFYWRLGLFLTFVVSALLLGAAERFGQLRSRK